jgi:DNA-binding response OmpR family regulator
VGKDIWAGLSGVASFGDVAMKVLIAEPEPTSDDDLERQLEGDGFEVVRSGEVEALDTRRRPSLVLVGDPEAVDACRSWDADVPVIVVGDERSEPGDRLKAFEHGCDDYVAPPFDYEELLARIRAVLRRSNPGDPDLVEAGEIAIDRRTRRVTVAGDPVELSGKEYALLVKLASDPGRVFTKEELLRDVWGYQSPGRTRTLDSHASRLRRKLVADGRGPFVINIWGVGYRLLE